MPELPPKIQDALKALVVFEKEFPVPTSKAITKFAQALISLWWFVRSNKDNNPVQVEEVKQHRINYVRSFLKDCSSLPAMLEEDWFHIRIVLSSMDQDLEILFREHQDLKVEYESFCNQYPNDEFERRKEQYIKVWKRMSDS